MQKTIAIDVMGGDFGPPVTVPAVLHSLAEHPGINFILVGDQPNIENALAQSSQAIPPNRISIHHTTETVAMHENPLRALKTKKQSSMRVCIDLIKSGDALACVSAGNTGALLAMAHYALRTLPGVSRPGLITSTITEQKGKRAYIIDLGANIDSEPKYLHDFAVMGAVMISAVNHIESPKVALLSNGHESVKGNQLVKKTAELLKASELNYVGYIEANDILTGNADLIVCDGFVGNITIKTAEGVTHFLKKHLSQAFQKSAATKLAGLVLKPILKKAFKEINPEKYNGASLLGVNGIVIKSHGGASMEGFSHAINEAVREAEHNVPELIRETLSKHPIEDNQ